MRMRKAKLEMLGLEFLTGVEYYDEGFVRDVYDRALEIFEEHDQQPPLDYLEMAFIYGSHEIAGDCIFMKNKVIVLYKKFRLNSNNIYVRAHGETHALEYLGGLDLLADKLLSEQNVKIDFDKIEESDIRADLGALYALHAHGVHPFWHLFMPAGNKSKSFKKAKKIYRQSRL